MILSEYVSEAIESPITILTENIQNGSILYIYIFPEFKNTFFENTRPRNLIRELSTNKIQHKNMFQVSF